MILKDRIKVGADFHSQLGHGEVIRVDIDADTEYKVVVEHLRTCKCIVIDLVYPDDVRLRVENIYYGLRKDDDDA